MKAYKVELDPNNKQRSAFLRHAGAARWAYNYGLRRKQEARAAGLRPPTAIDLHKEIVVLKHSTVPWLTEVSKCAPQQALRNLDVAYDNFFRRCKSKVKKKGFPKFKNRKNGVGTFTLEGTVSVSSGLVCLPRIGKVRLKEQDRVPPGVKVKSIVVSERAGKWFASVRTAEADPRRQGGTEILGIDVGINKLITLSDGTSFANPRSLLSSTRRLRQIQKAVSRKVKGSANRRRAVSRLARQHYRIACVRTDAIHKATTAILKRASTIVIESLNVAGMMKNHRLSRSLSDASMSEVHRQLEYKAKWSGVTVIKADRFFPSSKTCSRCGLVREKMSLSERTFRCECGFEEDRDVNAAINLRNLAVSSTVSACCPGSSGRSYASTKLLAGQEPNAIEVGGLDG